ncbi:MAG: hypothetical protein KIS92_26090 [Planctomycetota bacterium]|nr:hypothetical protein [Planctomycetota bacterium]
MRCQACGKHRPTRRVVFYRNIGALVMRFSNQIDGNLCKRCINSYFFEYTAVTLAVGWLGLISFFLAPIFVVHNVARYCGTLGLPADYPGGSCHGEHPTESLTRDAAERLLPFAQEIGDRLDYGEDLDAVAADVAPRANVSAVQVELFVEAVATKGLRA